VVTRKTLQRKGAGDDLQLRQRQYLQRNGIEIAKGCADLCPKHLEIDKNDVIVASTGVIGQPCR
jgi:hypothetical protein